MLLFNNKIFKSRKELKDYLGGNKNYNKMFYANKIIFINN